MNAEGLDANVSIVLRPTLESIGAGEDEVANVKGGAIDVSIAGGPSLENVGVEANDKADVERDEV